MRIKNNLCNKSSPLLEGCLRSRRGVFREIRFENLFGILFILLSSCSMGISVDGTPGATKLTIQNNSSVELKNVMWNNVEFGNISPSKVVEKIISCDNNDGGYIYFNNNEYKTQAPLVCLKFRKNSFNFIDNMFIENISLGEVITLKSIITSAKEGLKDK